VTEPDLGHQTLEAWPVRGGGARAAQIVIDDDDLFASPAQSVGAIRQTVLEVEHVDEIGVGLDTVEFAVLGQRGDNGPVVRPAA
jgi:hypothetical protein